MTAYAHHEFHEIVLFTAEVHDLQKGNNLTAEIRGTEDDACTNGTDTKLCLQRQDLFPVGGPTVFTAGASTI